MRTARTPRAFVALIAASSATGIVAARFPAADVPGLARDLWRAIEAREARFIELGDRARRYPEETPRLRMEADGISEQIQLCAAEDFAQIDSGEAADQFPFALAECRLAAGLPLTDAQPSLCALDTSPFSGGHAQRAYWWAMYGFNGPVSPFALEAAWNDLRSAFPRHHVTALKGSFAAAVALWDIGENERAKGVLDDTLALAFDEETLIVGRDTSFEHDPRAVTPRSIARIAALRASLESDAARELVLRAWAKRLESLPDGAAAVKDMWHRYARWGRPVEPFRAEALDGAIIDSAALRGRIVILTFSASWCGPCQQSLPYLKLVNEKYGQRVAVIMVNGDADKATARAWAAKERLPWPVTGGARPEKEPLYRQFDVSGIPHTIVIDADQRVLYSGGWEGDLPGIIERLLHAAE